MGQQEAKPLSGADWSKEHVPDVPDVVLSVFFEGTGNTIKPSRTLVGILYSLCAGTTTSAQDLASTSFHLGSSFKMAFDGCGVTHGIGGTLFAFGITTQCEEVIKVVRAVLQERPNVRLLQVNALGFSRGGISCIKLAKRLQVEMPKFENRSKVRLSMLLFDPVPGNAVSTGFPGTHTDAKDLTECDCLHRVLAVYPVEPLPDLTMHAPLLPLYPRTCKVEEDVTLGCHQGALFATQEKFYGNPTACAANLSFCRIHEWLTAQGTHFRSGQPPFHPTRLQCSDISRAEMLKDRESARITHDASQQHRVILRRSTKDGRPTFLNRYHERLERDLGPDDDLDCPEGSSIKESRSSEPRYLLDIVLPAQVGHACGSCSRVALQPNLVGPEAVAASRNR
mmetsp:Transcript_1350/g.3626  ORF Transcript_1350/g.3626 Transcript_1350/m.3626 type:complete len:395 (-) Transcript_1350:107-1291(-)